MTPTFLAVVATYLLALASHCRSAKHPSADKRDFALAVREYWMRRANAALAEQISPCPFAAFATAIVNHTTLSFTDGDGGSETVDPPGALICAAVNNNTATGDPTLHGEIAAISKCAQELQRPPFNLTPAATSLAFRDFTLYTNAEPCPMCASAIRWAGFREVVFGTSVESLVRLGWRQMGISSREVFDRSGGLGTTTELIEGVLSNETDVYFAWQFNSSRPCPNGCVRASSAGRCVRNPTASGM